MCMPSTPDCGAFRIGVDISERFIEVAIEVAQRAAAHVRVRRPELFGAASPPAADAIRTKSAPTDPVTVADRAAEAAMRALIEATLAQYPDKAMAARKLGVSRRTVFNKLERYRWADRLRRET